MNTKIKTTDFQVLPGGEFKLSDRPTKVESRFKSKKQYHELLREHVDELSESHIILETMKGLGISYPEVSQERRKELEAIRENL